MRIDLNKQELGNFLSGLQELYGDKKISEIITPFYQDKERQGVAFSHKVLYGKRYCFVGKGLLRKMKFTGWEKLS